MNVFEKSKSTYLKGKIISKHIAMLFLTIFFAAGTIGLAQTINDKTPAQPEIKVIQTSEISSKIEETIIYLKKVELLNAPSAEMQEIEKEKPLFLEELKILEEASDTSKLIELNIRGLNGLRQRWLTKQAVLSSWVAKAEKQLEQLEAEKENLKSIKELWSRTYQQSRKKGIPKTLLRKIKEVRKEISEKENKLNSRLTSVLTIRNTLSDQDLKIGENISLIDQTEKVKQEQLFSFDSEPIWNLFSQKDNQGNLLKQFNVLWKSNIDAAASFYNSYKNNIIYHAAFTIVLFILLMFLKLYVKNLDVDDEDFKKSTHILELPFSVGLLITLLFSNIFYPVASNILQDLKLLLLLIPMIRILPKLADKKTHKPIYTLAVLIFINKVYDLTPNQTNLQRLLLFFLSIVSLVILIRFVKNKDNYFSAAISRIYQAALVFSKVAILLFTASIISNVIGNVNLAGILCSGSIKIIYIAVLLYLSVKVLSGLTAIMIQTKFAKLLRIVRDHGDIIKNKIYKTIKIFSIFTWVYAVLVSFQLYDLVLGWFSATFGEKIKIGSLQISLLDIVFFIVTIWVSFLLSKFVRFILEGEIYSRIKLPRGVPAATSLMVNYFIIGFGFLIALTIAGIDLSKISLIIGALGVGIGFGLQNIVNNFISGLILIFERPIQVGDTIQIDNVSGSVKRIGIRSSTIRTFSGSEVIVPNADLISNKVTNWTLSDRLRRIEIPVGVEYGADPGRVIEILIALVKGREDVLNYPEPVAYFQSFGDSSLDFELRFWTSNYGRWVDIKSEVSIEMYNALLKAGINIPYPQRDLHITPKDLFIEKKTDAVDDKTAEDKK